MRLRRRHRSCPNAGRVKLQWGVTGARNELGEAGLAGHLPNRAAERPIFLFVARVLRGGLVLFVFPSEAYARPGFLGWIQQLLQVFKDEPYVLVMLLELAALFDHFLFHLLQLD